MAALRAASATDTGLGHADQDDALTCALLAWFFHCQTEQLVQPDPSVDLGEGWIFVLADGLVPAG